MTMTHSKWAVCLMFLCGCAQDDATAVSAGMSGGGTGGQSGAAGATVLDASTDDAAQDASNADATSANVDAGADAGGDSSLSLGDSGTADAGGARSYPTSRTDFGLGTASRCATADVLLCEDFEGDQLDDTTWSVETWGAGTATIDASRAARGNHSVHIQEPSNVNRVMLRETKTFAATGNHFFGRFFMYVTYTPDALQCPGGNCNNLVHWTAAAAGGDYMENGNTFQPEVRAIGAVNQGLLVNLDGGPKAEVGVSDNDSAPAGYKGVDSAHVGEWMCFEFEYAGEGDAAEVRVWWDGQEHPGLHYSTANRGDKGELWAIPKYDHLDFGFAHYQDYGAHVSAFDAWLDEIAVDDQRIGCAL
jgi:hypothetical protein